MTRNSISGRAVLHALGFAVAIALFSSVWLVIMTVTGWYRDPGRMEWAMAVPIVEIILLILASRQARRDGCAMPAGIGVCLAIALVAAMLSAGFAFAYTASQDDYFTNLQQAHAEGLRQAGKTDAEIAAMVASHPIATPRGFALNRFRNILVFGVIGSIVGLLATVRGKTQ